MPLPPGFFALSPLEGALGPFADARKATDTNFPVFARFRIRWWPEGLVESPRLPNAPLHYPAAVLYGGPAPREWAEKSLPSWVSQWTRSLAAPANVPAGTWYLEIDHPVLLVPPEALFFPYQDFRWSWFYDQAEPDVYQIEGQKSLPQFRNLRTGQWDRPGPFGNMFNEVPPVAISGTEEPPIKVALVPELTLEQAAATMTAKVPQLISPDEENEIDPPVRTWLTEDAWAAGVELPPWIVDNNEVGQGFYQRYRTGEKNGRCQCGATTTLEGVPTECSLIAGHPGPHLNGPPELGRVGFSCRSELEDPRTGWRCQCTQPGGHGGTHRAAGRVGPQESERGPAENSAANPASAWYRLHYLDVITGNDAWVPYRWLTGAGASSWVKQRTAFGPPGGGLL